MEGEKGKGKTYFNHETRSIPPVVEDLGSENVSAYAPDGFVVFGS